MKTISVIIPTYNEAPRIGAVLKMLCAMKLWKEVIVVDDGSQDETQQVVAHYPVTYLRNAKNLGKSRALKQGVEASSSELLFFCDADLKDFTPDQVLEILEPVLKGEKDLSMGCALHHDYFPLILLSGQRALTRSLWDRVPEFYKKGYRIEVGLNETSHYFGKGYAYSLQSYDHSKKECKRGFWIGLCLRIHMFVQVGLAYVNYQLFHVSRDIRSLRREVLKMGIGVFPLLASALFFFLGTGFGYRFLVALLFKEQKLRMNEDLLQFTHSLIQHYTAELYLILGGLFLIISLGFVIYQLRVLKRQFHHCAELVLKLRSKGI